VSKTCGETNDNIGESSSAGHPPVPIARVDTSPSPQYGNGAAVERAYGSAALITAGDAIMLIGRIRRPSGRAKSIPMISTSQQVGPKTLAAAVAFNQRTTPD